MTTMAPPAPRKGGQARIGAVAEGSTAARKGASAQIRTTPGDGQAQALHSAAQAKGIVRAEAIRQAAQWGLRRPIEDVRSQAPVPAAHRSTPLADKSITWVPQPGLTDQLDAQAAKVLRPNGRGTITRNELLRRHIAAWLDQQ